MNLLLLTLIACQDPFGSDRHTLEGHRIAAVEARLVGDLLHARPALLVDGHLWSDADIALEWVWLSPTELPADWQGTADRTGPWLPTTPPKDADRLLLLAQFPDESEPQRAVLDLPTKSPAPPVLTAQHLGLSLSDLDADNLSQDARSRLDVLPWTPQSPGNVVRWQVEFEGTSAARARWMSTAGTWFELSANTADLALGTLVFDRDEVVETTPMDSGWLTVLALVVDEGASTFTVADLPIGVDEPGGYVAQRWLPGAIPGLRWVQFEADDQAPMGLRARDDGAAMANEADGSDALDCAVTGPFSPDWLITGTCTRTQIAGQRLQVQVSP